MTHLEGHPPVAAPGSAPPRHRPVRPDAVGQYRRVTPPEALDTAVCALVDPSLAPIVDLVAWPDPDAGRDSRGRPLAVLVADHGGRARLDDRHPEGLLEDSRKVTVRYARSKAWLPMEVRITSTNDPQSLPAWCIPWK